MKRKALGKGIEAIISNKSSPELGNNFVEINIEDIYPNPFQPRKKFNIEKIKDLANSIKEAGMIQPVIVCKKAGKFYLVIGERRWRAVQYLKWKKIPAIIKDISTDDVMIGALVENIQREDLNAIEISEGIDMLMKKSGLNQENISRKLGMKRSTLTNFLRLLKLPEAIKQGVISNEITQGHARAILSLNSNDDMLEAFSNILKKKLSVRQTESFVKKFYLKDTKKIVQFDPDLQKIEDKLVKFFSTKVKLKYSNKGEGRIEIYFTKLDEFERIYKMFLKE